LRSFLVSRGSANGSWPGGLRRDVAAPLKFDVELGSKQDRELEIHSQLGRIITAVMLAYTL
jgi:hypothetical protein